MSELYCIGKKCFDVDRLYQLFTCFLSLCLKSSYLLWQIIDWPQAWVHRRGVSFLLEELIFRDTIPERHRLPSSWPKCPCPAMESGGFCPRPEQTSTAHPVTATEPIAAHPQLAGQRSTKYNCQPDRQHHPQLSSLISQ